MRGFNAMVGGISKLGRYIMEAMEVMGNNVVMKIGRNGSNLSNHEVTKLKLSHVIINQSIVVIKE